MTGNHYGRLKADAASIALAAKLLHAGELVAFPTETVYGLGAAALNSEAVVKIFEAKQRPFFDPLIVHIGDATWANELAEVSALGQSLMQAFWPGPLTLVLPRKKIVPDLVTSGLSDVALRVPAHLVAQELLHVSGIAIAAPSANLFGQLSPTRAEHVERFLGEKVALILDGGPCFVGVESTIVKVHERTLEILRPGAITMAQLQGITGVNVTLVTKAPVIASGMLDSHYAPRTPLYLKEKLTQADADTKTAALFFQQPAYNLAASFQISRVLSPSGKVSEAAQNLFSFLHELDTAGCQRILAEHVSEDGIGLAIMNRLHKAAVKD